MPRPGPRPYECVRRAWHSERHQPMRGLIIQQIFRLVHDNHSAATKKNKEWQEKLPVVVLKAEEIMYSKANSEAEYSNFETLWDRVNDAIDTIIRKDETTESGEFLPPCVEAALNLGCVPVRASRSQRHNNQRTYLRPSYQECSDLSTKFLNENVNEHSSDMIPTPTSNSSMLKITQNVDSPRLVWKCSKQIPPKINQQIASSFEKPHSIVNRNSTEVDCNSSLNRHSVYPLYYGSSFGPEGSQLGFREPAKTDSIIIGVPIFSTMPAPAEGGCLQNLFPYHENRSVAKETGETIAKVNKGKEPDIGFDLSLRLGPFPDSGSSMEKVSGCVTDNVGRVFHDEGLPREEFSFFPMEPACNSISLQQSKWSAEREKKNAELVSRTHKPPYVGDVENNRFFWSQDSTSNPFSGQMRRPGL